MRVRLLTMDFDGSVGLFVGFKRHTLEFAKCPILDGVAVLSVGITFRKVNQVAELNLFKVRLFIRRSLRVELITRGVPEIRKKKVTIVELKEHDVVKVRGRRGTVVHLHPGRHCEVEFDDNSVEMVSLSEITKEVSDEDHNSISVAGRM